MEIPVKLKRKIRNFGINGLTVYILITMGLIWAVDYIFPAVGLWEIIYFDRALILKGEVWRAVTFFFEPFFSDVLSALLSFLFYYSIGTAVENYWGSHKYTLYLLSGMVLLIICGFITGYTANYYLFLSLFFVYAILAPNAEFMLFFILPVKAKYLAIIDAVSMAAAFIFGTWQVKLIIAVSLIPLFAAFHKDIFGRISSKKRLHDFKKKFNDRNK